MIFSPDTAHSTYYRPECPSSGHCAVVAIYMATVLGDTAEILTCKVGKIPHWYNRYRGSDGKTVYLDLTGDQFGRKLIQMSHDPLYDGPHKIATTRGIQSVQDRYGLFLQRFRELLDDFDDYFALKALAELTLHVEPLSIGHLALTTHIQTHKKENNLPSFFNNLHYLVNPYTPTSYLQLIETMTSDPDNPPPGWYDLSDRIHREIARRKK